MVDIGDNVIDRFDASGKYLGQINGAETPAGTFAFAFPASIAVDNSTEVGDPSVGDVYVIDAGNHVIDKFDAGGKYIGPLIGSLSGKMLGLGVDDFGNVAVEEEDEFGGGEVKRFNSVGEAENDFTPPRALLERGGGFGVNSTGHLYVAERPEQVEKLGPTGAVEGTVDECPACQVGIAADFATDDVYIDDQTTIKEIDQTNTPLGEFGGAQLGAGGSGSIAVNADTGRIYVANASEGAVFVYGSEPGPRVRPQNPSAIGVSSATLNAEVDPAGRETSYQFEYGLGTTYGAVAPLEPIVAGAGTAFVAASTELKGLEGSSTYHYRIVASNANGTIRGADRTFTTAPIQAVEAERAIDLSPSSATLTARINPRTVETSYRFEWGLDTSYGHDVPVPNAVVGSGTVPVEVRQEVNGLKPDILYHWRVVTESGAGTRVSRDHTFVYDTSERALPDGRAYEMVSPPAKNGALLGDTLFTSVEPGVSAAGDRVMVSAIQCFGGAEACPAQRGDVGSTYSFVRDPSGWHTVPQVISAQEHGAVSALNVDATEGLSLFSAPNPVGGEDDFYLRHADGAVTDVGPVTPPEEGARGSHAHVTYGSSGLQRLVWTTSGSLWPFDATQGETFYESTPEGSQPQLLAVTGGRGSHDLIDVCGGNAADGPGSLTEDGSTFFMNLQPCPQGGSGANAGIPVPVAEVFARRNGEETIALSEPEANPACTTLECLANTGPGHESQFRDAQFEGASADGRRAFFTSLQQLTDTASQDEQAADADIGEKACSHTTGLNGCNLYEFECASCENVAERHVIDVSAGDTSGSGPRVQGVIAISRDGSHVYFVARGALTAAPNAEGGLPRAGQDNLYAYERDDAHRTGKLSFIAVLPGTDAIEWEHGVGNPANVTPDGRFLVFMSRGQLTPDDTSRSGALQVFRYDANTEQLIRVSKGENGFNDDGNRSSPSPCEANLSFCSEDDRIVPPRVAEGLVIPRSALTMSSDGSYIFFQSPLALVKGALDDDEIGVNEQHLPFYAQNVYEWHDGHVSLISDGNDVTGNHGNPSLCAPVFSSVCLIGTDSTGSNVFFTTADGLVPEDTDNGLDYYDARICTVTEPCIAAPKQAPKCEGEGCQVQAAGQPPAPMIASVTFVGLGNLTSRPRSEVRVKVVRHRVHGSGVTLTVTVPAGGRLAVTGRSARRIRRSIAGAGTYKIFVPLDIHVPVLHRVHTTRVRLRVTYRTNTGAESTAFVSFLVRK